MKKTIWSAIVMLALTAGTLKAIGPDAKQLAAKGHMTFIAVLGGDQARFAEAVKYMEDSQALDPNDAGNLYNLGRAYFYDAVTNGKPAAYAKAEAVLQKLMELQPSETRAVSFHGSLLTSMSQGKDIAMFMKGAQEMKKAIESDPSNVNNRIVLAFTARNLPPQALAAMGNYDSLKDLEFIRDAFAGGTFGYAPHAKVVMNAFVGDAYKLRGDNAKAKENFAAALAQPQPSGTGARAGRDLLDKAIRTRMDGGETPLGGGAFAGCHSCHLNAPDKLLKNGQF